MADGLQMGRESARRKHGQFRKDRHALAFERRAPCEVAGQRCGEIFSAFKGGAEWVANAYMLMLGALEAPGVLRQIRQWLDVAA